MALQAFKASRFQGSNVPANFTFVVCPLDVAGAGNPGKCERNRVKIDSRNLSVQVGEKREKNGTEKNQKKQAKQIKARTGKDGKD